MGSRRRLEERIANVNDLLKGDYKGEIDQRMKQGKLMGSSPEFSLVMSELKRDNGILAFYHDMFQLAKSNLEYAVAYRSNDPGTHYYYAKVLKLVGRNEEDKKQAENEFIKAASTDTRSRYLRRASLSRYLPDESEGSLPEPQDCRRAASLSELVPRIHFLISASRRIPSLQ